ncbi:hypothetical protein GA0070616_5250 [Micromonospora nigra]|uniref:LPXTG-motif cell wall anchor domain-containing protein n=1 Tax=Micromonospora nigra TaxID=145857 RepID=A0A1C6T119_9ACTN|nr:hypothetical protein [Micromonospora nigra]SCL35524.1 hypothetical protein GA0070616_5250 [Micromonospora nigra]
MRLSRIIMALAVGMAVVAVPTAAGAAQPQPAPTITDTPQPPPYPPAVASLTVSRSTIFLGESVVLSGSGFAPNETVDIVVSVNPLAAPAPGLARRGDGSTVALRPVAFQANAPLSFTVQTNAAGEFSTTYTPDVTGRLIFTATGRESGRTATTELRVLPKRQPLPVTGSSLDTPMKVGGGLVGAGAVLLLTTLVWRRRRFGSGAAH